jgi:hypothetical protein
MANKKNSPALSQGNFVTGREPELSGARPKIESHWLGTGEVFRLARASMARTAKMVFDQMIQTEVLEHDVQRIYGLELEVTDRLFAELKEMAASGTVSYETLLIRLVHDGILYNNRRQRGIRIPEVDDLMEGRHD